MCTMSIKFNVPDLNSYKLSDPSDCSIFICVTLPLTHSPPAILTSFCSSNMSNMLLRFLQWLLSLLAKLFTPHADMAHPLLHWLSSTIKCELPWDKNFVCFYHSSIPTVLAHSKCPTNISCCWPNEWVNYISLFGFCFAWR